MRYNSNQLTVTSDQVLQPARHTPLRNHDFVRGFTLIEMMVAVSIFSIVMMIGVGALLSLVEANRRAQAINSVVNNLNAALEGMSRSIRVGVDYHCGDWNNLSNITIPQNCDSGGELLAFESSSGDRSSATDQVVYRFNQNAAQLERSTDAGATWIPLTAPEVTIDRFSFFVLGSANGDTLQPRVLMILDGSTRVGGGDKVTRFKVQAAVVQRIIDI